MKSKVIFVKKENSIQISRDVINIVTLLSDGYEVSEIAKSLGIGRRTLEGRILKLKSDCNCRTLSHLVALFLRQKLIK